MHNEVPGEILRLLNRQVFHGEASAVDETVDCIILAFHLRIVGRSCRNPDDCFNGSKDPYYCFLVYTCDIKKGISYSLDR